MKPDPTPQENTPFRLDLLRDDIRVIHRSGGDLPALRDALAKMQRLRKRIPSGLVDSVAEVRSIRDSGGQG